MLQFFKTALAKMLAPFLHSKDTEPAMAVEWIIVGLGNPGAQYAPTRHNAGFMLIDALAKEFKAASFRNKFEAEVTSATIGETPTLLVKPQTFMNLSGQSVVAACQFYKIKPDHLIVLHDELDLPCGKLRVKFGGGAAGHNGLKSIDQLLGTQNYWRARIGIDHPGNKGMVSSYVLSPFAAEQIDPLVALLNKTAKAFPFWFEKSAERFQSETARLG